MEKGILIGGKVNFLSQKYVKKNEILIFLCFTTYFFIKKLVL